MKIVKFFNRINDLKIRLGFCVLNKFVAFTIIVHEQDESSIAGFEIIKLEELVLLNSRFFTLY
jgi:hypothetical protein